MKPIYQHLAEVYQGRLDIFNVSNDEPRMLKVGCAVPPAEGQSSFRVNLMFLTPPGAKQQRRTEVRL
jgi:hypothetical protein